MKELISKNIHSVGSKRFVSLAILICLVGAMLLSGCAGQALVNFTYDATTGAGSVQITAGAPPQATEAGGGGGTTGGSGATSQVVLFGVVVALLIGTLAVVAASARRRRIE